MIEKIQEQKVRNEEKLRDTLMNFYNPGQTGAQSQVNDYDYASHLRASNTSIPFNNKILTDTFFKKAVDENTRNDSEAQRQYYP